MDRSGISSRAADWVARLDREGGSPAVREELEQWLDQDRRHRGAFLRAQAAWTVLDRARVLSLPRASRRARPSAAISRRALMIGATGAGLAAAAAAGIGAVMLSQPQRQVYRTALGELRRIRLEDGSVMALNSQSQVEVVMGADFRRLDLVQGEAWFQVAHDATRPFTVEGAGSQVRAIGTAFSVRRGGNATAVMVTEGVVEISAKGDRASAVRLPAGSSASLAASGVIETAPVPVAVMQRSLAWREGQIALDGDTLEAAAEAFNRYNVRKLVIDGPELAQSRIVGWFWLDDPDAFARAAARTLNAEVKLRDQRIVLAARP